MSIVKDVKMFPSKTAGEFFGSVVLTCGIKLNNINVRKNKSDGSLFVCLPSKPSKKVDDQGKTIYFEEFHPISSQARTDLFQAILNGCEKDPMDTPSPGYKADSAPDMGDLPF